MPAESDGADCAGVGDPNGVRYRRADSIGQLANQEPVLGADLLGGVPGILGITEAHKADGGIAAAEAFAYVHRDGAVAEHQPGARDLGGVTSAGRAPPPGSRSAPSRQTVCCHRLPGGAWRSSVVNAIAR